MRGSRSRSCGWDGTCAGWPLSGNAAARRGGVGSRERAHGATATGSAPPLQSPGEEVGEGEGEGEGDAPVRVGLLLLLARGDGLVRGERGEALLPAAEQDASEDSEEMEEQEEEREAEEAGEAPRGMSGGGVGAAADCSSAESCLARSTLQRRRRRRRDGRCGRARQCTGTASSPPPRPLFALALRARYSEAMLGVLVSAGIV